MPRISDIVAATPSGQSIFGPSMRDIANQRKEQQRNAIAKILSNQNQQIMNRRNQLANTKTAMDIADRRKSQYQQVVGADGRTYVQEIDPITNRPKSQVPIDVFLQPKQGAASQTPIYNPRKLSEAKQRLVEYLPIGVDPYEATDAQYVEARETMLKEKLQTNPTYVRYQEQKAETEAEKQADEEKAREFASETFDVAERLLNSPGLKAAVGPIQGRILSTDKDTVDFEIDLETLISRLTKENLGIMKGVLSDNDIKILTNIGAGELKLIGSEQKMKDGLKRVMNKLAVASNRQIPYPEMQTSVGGKEVDLNGTRFTIQEVK